MIENAIKSLLLGDTTVVSANSTLTTQAATYAAVVAGIVGTRVYRVQLPRNSTAQIQAGTTLPAILIGRQMTPDRLQAHDGPLTLTNARVEVHAVALDSFVVAQLLTAVRKLLNGWHGAAGSTSGGPTVTVDRIFVEGGRDIPYEPIGGEELALAQSMIELNCWFREPLGNEVIATSAAVVSATSADFTFTGAVTSGNWTTAMIELETDTPGVYANPGAVAQHGVPVLRCTGFDSSVFAITVAGRRWRITTAPAGVIVPASGTIGS